MTKTILLDDTGFRLRGARMEGDVITRLAYDFPNRQTPKRTMLYRVKVTSIDTRMNAAFCDMGGGVFGFLRREGKLPPVGTRLIAEVKREGVGGKGPDLTDKAIIRTPMASMMAGGNPRRGLFGDDATQDDDFAAVAALVETIRPDGPLGPVDPRAHLVRVLMDLAEGGADEILVTSGELAAQVDEALRGAVPLAVVERAEIHPVLDEAEDDALMRTIPLSGGGRLVVDQAEALTAIDLDLGQTSGQSQKGAAARLLGEALSVMGRYAQLAQLGGQIVVDIPRGAIVAPKVIRDQLTRAFRPLGRIAVPAVTPEGVAVLITPKPGPTLLEQLTVPTSERVRHGRRFADDVLAAKAADTLERALVEDRTGQKSLTIPPALSRFWAESNKGYQSLKITYGPRFNVIISKELAPEEYHVT